MPESDPYAAAERDAIQSLEREEAAWARWRAEQRERDVQLMRAEDEDGVVG